MKQYAVAEIPLLALLELEVAHALFLALEVVDAKWVGGNQAVVAGVPPCWVAKVFGMIKHGDAHRVAVDLAPVVDPLGALAPECLVTVSGTVHRLAVGGGDTAAVAQTQVRVRADAHAALLRVAKRHVALRGKDRHAVRNKRAAERLVKTDRSSVGADHLAVRADPIVLGDDRAAAAPLGLHQLGRENLAGVFAVVPKTDAVDLTMREP